MYIVSGILDDRKCGCVINTFCQINSVDPIISISLNKDNYTNKVIRKSKKFAVSVISNDTPKDVIGKFGYMSSIDIDKFAGIKYEMVKNIPVVKENICGYVIVEVKDIVDCDTHDLIIGRVIDAKKETGNIPMTYKYYHENLKGISPKKAPTYVEDEIEDNNKYKCSLCGYIYDDSHESIKFEDLPDDWKCPLCGATKDMFEKMY